MRTPLIVNVQVQGEDYYVVTARQKERVAAPPTVVASNADDRLLASLALGAFVSCLVAATIFLRANAPPSVESRATATVVPQNAEADGLDAKDVRLIATAFGVPVEAAEEARDVEEPLENSDEERATLPLDELEVAPEAAFENGFEAFKTATKNVKNNIVVRSVYLKTNSEAQIDAAVDARLTAI